MSQPPKSRSQSRASEQRNGSQLPSPNSSPHSSPSHSPAPGSRNPSQARPDIQAQQQPDERANARSPSVMSSDYDTEGPTEQRHRRRRIRGKKDLPPVDYDLETDESRNKMVTRGQKDVTRTGDPKQVRQGGGAEGKKKDDGIAKLRLDLNLEVEVELRAAVHGDITLSMFESD